VSQVRPTPEATDGPFFPIVKLTKRTLCDTHPLAPCDWNSLLSRYLGSEATRKIRTHLTRHLKVSWDARVKKRGTRHSEQDSEPDSPIPTPGPGHGPGVHVPVRPKLLQVLHDNATAARIDGVPHGVPWLCLNGSRDPGGKGPRGARGPGGAGWARGGGQPTSPGLMISSPLPPNPSK